MFVANKSPFFQTKDSLSESQERIWFLQQLQIEYFGFNIPGVLKIRGPLNIRLFEKSINLLLQRHTIFHATFPFVDGKPTQILNQLPYQSIEIQELKHISQPLQNSEAARLMTAAVKNPFDLNHGPLIRFTLYCLDNEEYLFLIIIHQIICDTYSTAIIFNEIIKSYQTISIDALQQESPNVFCDCAIPPPSLDPYQTDAKLSYWENQLSDLPILELPTDWSRPSMQTSHGSTQLLVLPGNVCDELHQFSRQVEVDVPLIILGVLQSLLYRYTHQADLAVGYAMPGRTWPDTTGRIGYFENFLVLRTKLSEASSFSQLLTDLKITFSEAVTHQEVPFVRIVRALHADLDLTRTPLFQVLFRYMAGPAVHAQVQDLQFEEYEASIGVAPYDLTLKVLPQGDSIHCFFNYNTDLFSADTISRLIGHFQSLLNAIIASPEEPISILPLLTPSESRQMLVEWNDTNTPYPKDQCLQQLFEAQVSRAPQSMALSFNGRQLSYQQLDTAANQLAHYLIKLGVGPQIPVGICVEPSETMVIGMLGILKAGGSYVPLDPDYPRERIRFMLEDTGARILLTQQSLLKKMPGLQIRTILLDKDNVQISLESTEKINVDVKSHFPACIFYTSGSTGRPKGVPVPHYAIHRLVCQTNYVNFLPSDRVAQASNISFDGATFEIWGALLNGGCLVGLPKEILLSPSDLAAFVRQENINVLFLTPALFHECAREVPDAFKSIRDLVMGGEILETRWVREVLEHGPPARLLNAYGPTECTTFATWYEVAKIPPDIRSIPIGRPISNATTYILDRNLQPVPIGITGELYIGGDGLALGYLNRPEQTAEKFLPNPFHSDPSSRLYKTGDLARFLPDGNVEFLGRIDHQIKIRGFRIEPGEIEEALQRYPGVEEALVVVREAEPGDKSLVAYIVTSRKSSVTSEALRNFLHDLLPPYMIPAFFVSLEKFPLTPNGKIDRQALPVSDLANVISSPRYVEPRDEVERQLTQAWERVLGIRRIGVNDDFFSLGGNSLLGARLFINLEKKFGMRVPLYVLYQRTTIAQLAEVFRNQQLLDNVTRSILEPINPFGNKTPFFLINLSGTAPALKRFIGSDQPFYNLKPPFNITDMSEIATSLEDIAAHYLDLMRQVQPTGPYLVGGYCSGGKLALALAHKIQEQGDELAFLFLLDPTPITVKNYSVSKIYYRMIYRSFITLPLIEKFLFLKEGIQTRIKRTILEFFYRRSINMPKSLHKFVGDQLAYRSTLSLIFDYIPNKITNRVLLILSNQDTPELQYNWLDILKGQVEVQKYNIPHGEVLFSPYFEIWADSLKKTLQEIHTAIRKDSR